MNDRVIMFPVGRRSKAYEKRRTELINQLYELEMTDADAFFQLDDFCLDRRRRVDHRVARLLINKGILTDDGELPDLTNEAMYEIRTGYRPFWMDD